MRVAILGAGTMGRGIAHVFAVAGHDVALQDVDEAVLGEACDGVRSSLEGGVDRGKLTGEEAQGALERVSTTTDAGEAATGADLVVEAVPEDLDLKREVLSAAEVAVGEDALVATNTSSLSVTAVANALERPERALGLHFFNPPYAMDLVEVVAGEATAEAALERGVEVVADLGKTAIEVRDSPGFASSRLGVALGAEAMRMVETGVADAAAIDAAMELGYGHPMGPLELTDVVGLDVRLDVLTYLRGELGERFRPPQVLRRKVRAGHLGRKSGRGFYVWDDGEAVRPADGGGRDG